MSRTRRMAIAAGSAVAVAALLLLVLGASLGRNGAGNGIESTGMQGRPAPSLRGTTLDGASYVLAPRQATATVVTIWAAWCAGCRDELPVLARAADAWRHRGVRFVTVDTRDGDQAARDVLAETHASRLTTVRDPDGRRAVAWGVTGVPETVIVDRHGIIRGRWLGAVRADWLRSELTTWARG